MSSNLKLVAVSAKPNMTNSVAKPQPKKQQPNKKKGRREKNKKNTVNRVREKGVQILRVLAERALAVEDGQKMMAIASRNAFAVRMPPMEHSRGEYTPLTTFTNESFSPSSTAQCMVFIPNLSTKFQLGWAIAASTTSTLVLQTGRDALNLADIQATFKTIRVGLCALEIAVATTSDVLRPRLYVCQVPNDAVAVDTFTPAALLSKCKYEEITATNYAYVCNIPDSSTAPALHSGSSHLLTGPSPNLYPIIILTNLGTDATKVRVDTRSVLQGEGEVQPLMVGSGITSVESEIKSSHVAWDMAELYDKVTDFVYKSKAVYDGLPPKFTSAAATLAMQYLSRPISQPTIQWHGLRALEEATITMHTMYGPIMYTIAEARNIVKPSNRDALARLQEMVSSAEYNEFLAFASQPEVKRCELCKEKAANGSLCSDCRDRVLRDPQDQKHPQVFECRACGLTNHTGELCGTCQKVATDMGIQSVDATPEHVTRQLDDLRKKLLGKSAPVKDLTRLGIDTKAVGFVSP